MASDFIAIDVQNDIAKKLKNLPDNIADEVIPGTAEYLKKLFQAYPSYRYVSRKSAYGVTFFSERQRRWFFAALNSGALQIPYRRTQTMRKGWTVIGGDRYALLANQTPYADLLMGDGQSRHAAKIGWKKMTTIIQEKAQYINKEIDTLVKKAIKKLGL